MDEIDPITRDLQDDPDYWKGQAMRLASEVTDLAAALDAQHTWTEHEINRLMRERDEAKAEIARLNNQLISMAAVLEGWETTALKAEIARLQRENSDLNHNIVGMRSSNTNLVAERDAAKAEVARLQSDLSDLEEVHETLRAETKRADYWKAEAEKARAEIERLRKAFQEYARVTTPMLRDSKALAAAVNALKPDPYENSKPGESWNKAYQPTEDALVKAKAEVDRLRSGITPNVSRDTDTGEKP